MEKTFDIAIPAYVQRVMDVLEAAGFEAYIVGGCVRDAVLQRKPNDWDVTTSAKPEQTKAAFEAAGYHCVEIGAEHGTIGAIIPKDQLDGIEEQRVVEATTFRGEGSYTDHRHPDSVEFLERIDGDLCRRDFTVNAMAFSKERGLIDLFGGREDLEAHIIRCVGDARERFEEDALRILRCIRFASVLGFNIAPETAAAVHECRELLNDVSAERIWAEFGKLLCGPSAVPILREFRDVVAVIIPQLEPTFDFDQHNPFHKYDVWEHTLHSLQAARPDADAVFRLAVLLHDVAKPQCFSIDEDGIGHMYGHEAAGEPIAQEVCKQLRLGNEATKEVTHLVRWHMFSIPETPKAMRRFLLKHGEKGAKQLFAIRRCDRDGIGTKMPPDFKLNVAFAKAEELMEEQLNARPVFGVKDLKVNGRDLMELGFVQGPELGKALNALLEAVVDGDVPNEKAPLLDYAGTLQH